MNRHSTLVKVKNISYGSRDSEVLVCLLVLDGFVWFEYEIFISYSELNRLLNCLQSLNPSVIISDLFEEDFHSADFSFFKFDASILEHAEVALSFLSLDRSRMWIRA